MCRVKEKRRDYYIQPVASSCSLLPEVVSLLPELVVSFDCIAYWVKVGVFFCLALAALIAIRFVPCGDKISSVICSCWSNCTFMSGSGLGSEVDSFGSSSEFLLDCSERLLSIK